MKHIKPAAILIFLNIALLLNYLREPYFVLFGLFYLDSLPATILVLILLLLYVLIGIMVIKKRKKLRRVTKFLSIFLIVNSVINTFLAIFIAKDMAGYLERLFEQDVFLGFIVLQIGFIIVNVMLLFRVKRSNYL